MDQTKIPARRSPEPTIELGPPRRREVEHLYTPARRLASKSPLPASTIGLCHWLFSELDADGGPLVPRRLAHGDGLAADEPIAVLRNRIVKMRVAAGRVHETEALARCILAWNAYRAGVTRTKLQLPRGGLTAENFPEPR